MNTSRRTSLAGGLFLILIGVIFLAFQFVPALQALTHFNFTWPLIIVIFGLFLLVLGLLTHTPGMAIPATIVAGIGGILYYQNATNTWESWAYIWTLIPGFVGLGTILGGILGMDFRSSLESGAWLIFISLLLFFIFGSILGGMSLFGPYWPLLLVFLGLLILVRPLFRHR